MSTKMQTSYVACILCGHPVAFRYEVNTPCKIQVQCGNCKDLIRINYNPPGGQRWHSHAR